MHVTQYTGYLPKKNRIPCAAARTAAISAAM